ncbi:MAG: sulfite exporter TauE/SafE family protein [Chloroflexi bacterium]|nr:sulfite exporter TauE/SafE family protein [Chloroflexota bacterium]MQC27333.1 sulfite exporter TauE/SafE family protein [Chloroflexota bacterium]
MELTRYGLVVVAGFFAGIINTLAGSGSLITLPVLIFLGLPATVANGTNRIGVVLQNVVAGLSFRRQGVLDGRGALILSTTAILGSLLGAQIAVNLDEALMQRTIGVVMVLMLFVIVLRPQRWLQGKLLRLEGWATWRQHAAMFVIGMYGGFIQAGVGIFMLAALVLVIGYDLVRANAVKIVVILIFTVFALGVFVRNGQVDWGMGLLLAIGNMLGAWTAARVAVERGAAWVRKVLIVVVTLSAGYLLGVFEWLGRLL